MNRFVFSFNTVVNKISSVIISTTLKEIALYVYQPYNFSRVDFLWIESKVFYILFDVLFICLYLTFYFDLVCLISDVYNSSDMWILLSKEWIFKKNNKYDKSENGRKRKVFFNLWFTYNSENKAKTLFKQQNKLCHLKWWCWAF